MIEGIDTAVGCVCLIIGLFFGAFISCVWQSESWKKEAVEKGHAEYVLKGNEAVWQWKELKHKETP